MTAATLRTAASRPVEAAGRIGLVARGVVYVVLASLAMSVATGGAEHDTDTVGALHAVGSRPYGEVLLYGLALALACYAAWHIAQAATGRTSSREQAGWGARLASGTRAVAYLSLAAAAVKLASAGQADSAAEQQQSVTATVLGWPAGPWLVGAVGVVVIAAGVVETYNGLSGAFLDRLARQPSGSVRRGVVRTAGTIGHAGRGVAYGMIGVFVLLAALEHDPSKSRGLDGALADLAGRSYGRLSLLLLAACLLAFGAYSMAEARWRRIRA